MSGTPPKPSPKPETPPKVDTKSTSHLVGVPCPFCDSLDNVVLKTLADLGHIDRNRRCRKCELSFTTIETVTPGQADK